MLRLAGRSDPLPGNNAQELHSPPRYSYSMLVLDTPYRNAARHLPLATSARYRIYSRENRPPRRTIPTIYRGIFHQHGRFPNKSHSPVCVVSLSRRTRVNSFSGNRFARASSRQSRAASNATNSRAIRWFARRIIDGRHRYKRPIFQENESYDAMTRVRQTSYRCADKRGTKSYACL